MQNVNVSRVCPYDLGIRAQPHNAPARHLPDETDKNLVTVRANSVPGVFSVTNNLRVVQG
jgi:hypothetical protein